MADIRICALGHSVSGGPNMPLALHCRLIPREWPSGGNVLVVSFSFGSDTVEVWPADPEGLHELANDIRAVAKRLEGQ